MGQSTLEGYTVHPCLHQISLGPLRGGSWEGPADDLAASSHCGPRSAHLKECVAISCLGQPVLPQVVSTPETRYPSPPASGLTCPGFLLWGPAQSLTALPPPPWAQACWPLHPLWGSGFQIQDWPTLGNKGSSWGELGKHLWTRGAWGHMEILLSAEESVVTGWTLGLCGLTGRWEPLWGEGPGVWPQPCSLLFLSLLPSPGLIVFLIAVDVYNPRRKISQ